jgi:phosphatidylglycerophosphate synthase
METANRRQLRTRSRAWPSAIARRLASAGVTPNQVSVASVVFAFIAGHALFFAGERVGDSATLWLVVAAAGIQLRLLCNLLDGLLAIEGGLKTKTGELYNEIPDRIADIMILLGAGVAIHEVWEWGIWLGVFATILALLTAYVRLLGGSLGLPQDFSGPMAKQHRMFVLTVGALAGAIEHALRGTVWSLVAAMVVIVVGSVATVVLRTRRIAKQLKAR